MDSLEDLVKKMTNKTKGTVLIGTGILICIGGFLMADFWLPNASLLFNIKNSYITIFQDPRALVPFGEQSRTIRLPFSIVFFISSLLVVIGAGFILVGKDKKH